MWHTSTGQRVLRGAEAELVKASLQTMVESICEVQWDNDEIGFFAGIDLYDNLPWTQKLAVVEQVARHLLTETATPLPLNAINEAVIGAIFENIKQEIECEIEQQREFEFDYLVDESLRYLWRNLVLAAQRAVYSETAQRNPFVSDDSGLSCESDDEDAWVSIAENLADRILWDRDYELAAAFLDDDPETAAADKEMFGIDNDYFIDLPPDPREDQLEPILFSVRDLILGKAR